MMKNHMNDTTNDTGRSAMSDDHAVMQSCPSPAKRTLLKAVWIAPVIAVVSLPASSYVANGSGFDPNKD